MSDPTSPASEPPEMGSLRAALEEIRGDQCGRIYALKVDQTLIGRAESCDLVFRANHYVSSQHARIVRHEETYYLEDLKSTNATYLNGEAIQPFVAAKLRDGDQIGLAQAYLFRFVLGAIDTTAPEDTHGSTIYSASDPEDPGWLAAQPELKLQAILEISRHLATTVALREMLEQTLEVVFDLFHGRAQRGFVLLCDPLTGELIPKAIQRRSSRDPLRVVRSIASQVIRLRRGILFHRTHTIDDELGEASSIGSSVEELRITTLLCVPLIDRDQEPIGIIQLDTTDPDDLFDENDLNLLVAVAYQVSLAVQGHQAHQAMQAQAVMERELRLARDVQRSLIPAQAPSIPGYRLWFSYMPARAVGGDYIGVLPIVEDDPDAEDPQRWVIALGDVAGKGMPAALQMVRVSTLTRIIAGEESDPSTIVTRINQELCAEELSERFVTFLLGQLDCLEHRVRLANAGHMPPLLRKADGQVLDLRAAEDDLRLPLAIIPEMDYPHQEVMLDPGDLIVLYTDGISEAINEQGQSLGTDPLISALAAGPDRADQAGPKLLDMVRDFLGDQPRDDIALLCLSRDCGA